MHPCMYNATIPQYMMAQQPSNGFEKAFEIYEKLQKRELKKQIRKEQEDKNKNKPPKKFRDFTFIETAVILMVLSQWVGPIMNLLQNKLMEMTTH